MVPRIRARWPEVKIVLRGDSGFCREELMAWCEANQVDYVFGLGRNSVLQKRVAEALEQARQLWEQTQQPARVFLDFEHETASGTWSRRRRDYVEVFIFIAVLLVALAYRGRAGVEFGTVQTT